MDTKSKSNSTIYKSLTITVMLFVVLLVISIVLLFLVINREDALKGADRAIRLSAQGGFDCEYAEAQKLFPFEEGVLKVLNDRVAYLTLSGNEVYSNTVNYQNPICSVNNDHAIVCDMDGYTFSMYTQDHQVFVLSTTEKIKAVSIASDGKCAIICDSEDAFGQVTIYDENGVFIASWISYDSGYPLAAVFNSDSSKVMVSAVNTDGATYESYIKVFSIVYEGSKYTASDYSMYIIPEDTIVSALCYCGEAMYAFSSSSIYTLSGESFAPLTLDIGSVNYEAVVGDNLFIIYSDGVDQMNKLAILDSSNQIVYNSPVGSVVNAYCYNDSYFALSIDRRIYVFDATGKVVADISVDEDVLRLGYIENDRLVVVSTGGVHSITY